MHSTLSLILVIALSVSSPVLAQQEKKDIYANPQNLEVLAKDISSRELADTMKGFAMGLGVRCETCHVGEPNTPLETFDFASDEKQMKSKARIMLSMVYRINGEYLGWLDEIEQEERVPVRCVTCHRGRPQPKLIEDVLDEQLATYGLESALDKYAALREEFYGSHSYDFSEYTLPMYAQKLAAENKSNEAIALVRVNADHFPDSYYSFFVLGELYRSTGQPSAATDNYRKAIELNPQAGPFLEGRIKELDQENP